MLHTILKSLPLWLREQDRNIWRTWPPIMFLPPALNLDPSSVRNLNKFNIIVARQGFCEWISKNILKKIFMEYLASLKTTVWLSFPVLKMFLLRVMLWFLNIEGHVMVFKEARVLHIRNLGGLRSWEKDTVNKMEGKN